MGAQKPYSPETLADRISKRRLRRARGRGAAWVLDEDWWLSRPECAGDRPHSDFADSQHAFREAGRLYCRNRRQAAILDCGGIV